jgi:hypothetical protein
VNPVQYPKAGQLTTGRLWGGQPRLTIRNESVTCGQEHCNCRVLVLEECTARGFTDESIYRCVCGAELAPVKD